MLIKIHILWYWLRSSFWFVPALMTILAIALAFGATAADRHFKDYAFLSGWWAYAGDLDSARSILSTIANSMITVAGVVFSITIVVLSLASSQFGPRLIWNFMHDKGNQLVLGTFVSAFTYCILVIGLIGVSGGAYIPHISVSVGILLAAAGVAVLIYFIHHISASIHANTLVASVWRDLEKSIDRLFPEKMGHELTEDQGLRNEEDLPRDFDSRSGVVPSLTSGYLQAVNAERIMRLAKEKNVILRIEYRPGKFIVRGSIVARVWPGNRVDDTLIREMSGVFVTGNQRMKEQDVEFSVHQLVEIAVRSLSQGINDPFTAMTCLDWLGVALSDLAGRRIPSGYRYDDMDRLRVVAPQFTFPDVADAAFNQIRQYGKTSVGVMIRMLEIIAGIAPHIRRDEDRDALLKHALMTWRESMDNSSEPLDRQDIDARYQRVLKALRTRDSEILAADASLPSSRN